MSQLLHLLDRHGEAPAGNGRNSGVRIRADHAGSGVDREVHARIKQGRRDDRHDRDEGLEGHAAVADQAHVSLAADELRCGAAGDQRMKTGDRSAGDGDEDERKDLAGEDRPVPRDELGERRHLQHRMDDDDRDGEQRNHAELEESRQIAAWREQQPHGNDGRQPAIPDHESGQLGAGEVEQAAQSRILIEPATARDAEQQQYHADDRSLQHAARPHAAHIHPDRERNRNGGEYREGRPGAALHRIHDHERQHRDQDDHDHEGAGERGKATEGSRAHRAPSARGCVRRDGWT